MVLTNLELLDSSEENLEWFSNNFKEIQDKFSNKIIAIKDKKVIASAKNSEELLKTIKKNKIDESEVLIEIVNPSNEITIL